jgi:hypothetical protein
LVGKPEGKRPLVRPRRRWKNTIKMDLREIMLEGVDWIHVAEDRGRSCEHGDELSFSIKGGEFLDWLSALLVSQEGLCSMELVRLHRIIVFYYVCKAVVNI